MENWRFKKADFKINRKPVYEGYLFETFQGYFYKEKRYQLVQKKTLKGTEYKEKFIGYGYSLFHRGLRSWEQWKQLSKEM